MCVSDILKDHNIIKRLQHLSRLVLCSQTAQDFPNIELRHPLMPSFLLTAAIGPNIGLTSCVLDNFIVSACLITPAPLPHSIPLPKRRFMDVVKYDMAEVKVTEEDTEYMNNWKWKIRRGDPRWEKPKEEEEEPQYIA